MNAHQRTVGRHLVPLRPERLLRAVLRILLLLGLMLASACARDLAGYDIRQPLNCELEQEGQDTKICPDHGG